MKMKIIQKIAFTTYLDGYKVAACRGKYGLVLITRDFCELVQLLYRLGRLPEPIPERRAGLVHNELPHLLRRARDNAAALDKDNRAACELGMCV